MDCINIYFSNLRYQIRITYYPSPIKSWNSFSFETPKKADQDHLLIALLSNMITRVVCNFNTAFFSYFPPYFQYYSMSTRQLEAPLTLTRGASAVIGLFLCWVTLVACAPRRPSSGSPPSTNIAWSPTSATRFAGCYPARPPSSVPSATTSPNRGTSCFSIWSIDDVARDLW